MGDAEHLEVIVIGGGQPGMPYPAPPGAVVTRDEIANYLESYAQRFGLPIRDGVRVDNERSR